MGLNIGGRAVSGSKQGSRSVGSSFFGSRAAGGAPAVPIVETAPLYADSFNAYPDNTILVGGAPNWQAISAAGNTTGERFNAAVVSGEIRTRTTGSVAEFSEPSKYLITPPNAAGNAPLDLGPNHFFEYRVKSFTSVVAGVVAATDELNLARLEVTGGGAGMQVVNRVAGTATTLGSQGFAATNRYQNFKSAAVGDVLRIEAYGGRIYMKKNGVPIGNAAGYATSLTGTKVGFTTSNGPWRNTDDFKASTLTGKLALSNTNLKAYPRIQGLGGYPNGGASIAFTGTYEGTVSGLQWALFDPETGQKVKEWARATGATISGGNWSATVIVPCGLATYADGSARDGRKPYRIAFRAENDTFVEVQGTVPFWVCYTVVATGQSNGANLTGAVSDGSVIDHPGGLNYTGSWPSLTPTAITLLSAWEVSTVEGTANDRAIGEFTRQLGAALNLPIYFINVCIPATAASAHDPLASQGTSDWIRAHLAAAGGAFDSIYVSQGENEIFAANTVGALAWKAQWLTNVANWRTLSGQPGGTTIPVYFALTGQYAGGLDAAAPITRKAQAEIVSEIANAYMAHHMVGLTLGDAVHFTGAASGYVRMATRIGLTFVKVLAGGAYDGRGPLAGTPTRAGAVVTIPVNLNGATSLTCLSGVDGVTAGNASALTTWEASTDPNFGSLLTISSAVLSGNNVVLTLSADPGALVYVRNYSTAAPDVSSWVFGSYADGSSIGMEPVVKPIQTAS